MPGVEQKRWTVRGDVLSYEERKWLGSDENPELMFREILENMDKTIGDLMAILQAPEEVKLGTISVYRFSEKRTEQAIVLKLAFWSVIYEQGDCWLIMDLSTNGRWCGG